MTGRRDELEQFKTQINLCEYLASRGFVLDRKHSSRCSAVMRHSNGDKLIIARTPARHWVYFNVHGGDSGSIIDCVQARDRVSLGEVRKELRPWIGRTAPAPASLPSLPIDLEPSQHDAARVLAAWMKTKPINGRHQYLEETRQIPSSVLSDPIFHDRIRIDARANALFPHWNQQASLSGFAIKNRGFTGFSPGGIKGLWCSRPRPDDRDLYLCETAIDALSVATLLGTAGKRFFSTAGQISPAQAACIRSAVSKMPDDGRVVLAVDNDDGGRKLIEAVRQALATAGFPAGRITEHLPDNPGDDWNDVLKASRLQGPASPIPV